MKCEFAWGDAALEEFDAVCEEWAQNAPRRGIAFVDAVDDLVSSLKAFSRQGVLVETELPFDVRRVRLRAFTFLVSYTVYPSVDPQTGEPLDVVYVLACRHERQNEPNWSARDPFQVP